MRELVLRGTEVTYYTTGEFRESIERAGAEFRSYPEPTLHARDIAEATQTGSALRVVVNCSAPPSCCRCWSPNFAIGAPTRSRSTPMRAGAGWPP